LSHDATMMLIFSIAAICFHAGCASKDARSAIDDDAITQRYAMMMRAPRHYFR